MIDPVFVDVILSVNADNDTVSNLRNIVTKISGSEAWSTSFEGTKTYVVNGDNAESIVNKTLAAVDLNS